MDWVPGGIDRMFATYERIVSHQHADQQAEDQKPTINAPNEAMKPDAPPWQAPETAPQPVVPPTTPEEWYGPRPLTTKAERDAQRLKDTGCYDLGERMAAGEQRLRDHIANPQGATFKQDEDGLVNAYQDKTSTGVYYDPATRTEYVKGSVTGRDFYDDFTKIPMWGNTRDAERYQQADAAYEDLQASGKPVDRIVGHSLGGSVALQLQQDKGIPRSRTFGAPVVDLKPFDRYYGNAERYRHPLDPVSILDRGAKWGDVKLYSHSYTGYEGLQ